MGIEHTCYTCQGCGNGKGQQLIFGNIDSHRLCCNTIVPGRHDRASTSGMNQILYNEQSDQKQNHTDNKEGTLNILVKCTCT